MRTKILKIKGDWQDVVNDCRASVDKPPIDHEPSSAFKKRILISEHGPIRGLWIKFQWLGIPYWCAMHWKTHIWPSIVNTQRNDRQDNYDRDAARQDMPVNFTGEANPQHTIDTWRKRLCRQASFLTRKYAENFKRTLRPIQPEWSDVLVPNCVYRCGCPEKGVGKKCEWYAEAVKKYPGLASTDIQTRYDTYNEVFYGNR